MIGLGKWEYSVNTVYFTGTVVLGISDDGGKHKIEVLQVETEDDAPEFVFHDITEEGNSLIGKGEISLLPGSMLDLSLTFEGDVMTGFLKVPYVGKIKIKDGKKVG